MNEEEYNKMACKKANDNHIWLNGLDCIDPTPRFKQQIGELVLKKLACNDCLVPDTYILSENQVMQELAKDSSVLYLKINIS